MVLVIHQDIFSKESFKRLMTCMFIYFTAESHMPFSPDVISDISHQDPMAIAYSENNDGFGICYLQFQYHSTE